MLKICTWIKENINLKKLIGSNYFLLENNGNSD